MGSFLKFGSRGSWRKRREMPQCSAQSKCLPVELDCSQRHDHRHSQDLLVADHWECLTWEHTNPEKLALVMESPEF